MEQLGVLHGCSIADLMDATKVLALAILDLAGTA
jgi:hypothetical protein